MNICAIHAILNPFPRPPWPPDPAPYRDRNCRHTSRAIFNFLPQASRYCPIISQNAANFIYIAHKKNLLKDRYPSEAAVNLQNCDEFIDLHSKLCRLIKSPVAIYFVAFICILFYRRQHGTGWHLCGCFSVEQSSCASHKIQITTF